MKGWAEPPAIGDAALHTPSTAFWNMCVRTQMHSVQKGLMERCPLFPLASSQPAPVLLSDLAPIPGGAQGSGPIQGQHQLPFSLTLSTTS